MAQDQTAEKRIHPTLGHWQPRLRLVAASLLLGSASWADGSGHTADMRAHTPGNSHPEPAPYNATPSEQSRGEPSALTADRLERCVVWESVEQTAYAASRLPDDSVRRIQQRLLEQGYYPGIVDGVFGPLTTAALTRYFRAQARDVAAGKLSPETLILFGIDPQLVTNPERDATLPASARADHVPTAPLERGSWRTPDLPTRRPPIDNIDDMDNPTVPPDAIPNWRSEAFNPKDMPPEEYDNPQQADTPR